MRVCYVSGLLLEKLNVAVQLAGQGYVVHRDCVVGKHFNADYYLLDMMNVRIGMQQTREVLLIVPLVIICIPFVTIFIIKFN